MRPESMGSEIEFGVKRGGGKEKERGVGDRWKRKKGGDRRIEYSGERNMKMGKRGRENDMKGRGRMKMGVEMGRGIQKGERKGKHRMGKRKWGEETEIRERGREKIEMMGRDRGKGKWKDRKSN